MQMVMLVLGSYISSASTINIEYAGDSIMPACFYDLDKIIRPRLHAGYFSHVFTILTPKSYSTNIADWDLLSKGKENQKEITRIIYSHHAMITN